MRAGARLALVVMAHVIGTSRGLPALISPPLASQPGEAAPEEVLCRLPREGLKPLLVKMGRTGPLAEPRHGSQAGKSGDPRSQNADRTQRGAEGNDKRFSARYSLQALKLSITNSCVIRQFVTGKK